VLKKNKNLTLHLGKKEALTRWLHFPILKRPCCGQILKRPK